MRKILEYRDYINTHRSLWEDINAKKRFSMKADYMSLSNTPKMSWYKLLLNNPVRPKSLLIMWLACNLRLATKSILFNFGMVDNKDCVFCRQEETTSHLLFDCDKLKYI